MWTKTLGALCVAIPLVVGGCGDDTKPTTPAGSTGGGTTTPPAATVTVADAQKLLDQATQYIKDNKLELADKAIKQLEDAKPKLPAEYGPKIDHLRTAFNAATASGALGTPKAP